jgi:hypothetical protein
MITDPGAFRNIGARADGERHARFIGIDAGE